MASAAPTDDDPGAGDASDRGAAVTQSARDPEAGLREHERQLTLLHRATREFVRAEDAESVSRTVLDTAQEVLGFHVSGVRLVRGGELVPVAMSEGRRTELGPAPTYELEADAPPARAFRRGEAVVLSEVGPVADDQSRERLQSAAFLPLGDHGTLSVATVEDSELTDDDLRLLEILAANATVALDRLDQQQRAAERERALQAERNKLAALFENAVDPTIEYAYEDGEPVVERANEPFEAVFGFEESDAVGRHVDELVVPRDRSDEAEAIDDRIRAGERVDEEVRRQTASGELRDFRLRNIPVDDSGQRGYAVYTDITRRKAREQRLQVLNRVLRHNLRNDMNVILGITELVLSRLDDPELRGKMESVRGIGKRLLDRSNLARTIEETLADPEDDPDVDVAAIADEEAAALASRRPAVQVETTTPPAARASAGPNIRTAIRELLDNAVDHNDRDAPTVEVAVERRTRDRRQMVVVSVADDGPGIPEHERAVLVEGSETKLRHGSGLGLWLVRWVVQATGGWLEIDHRDPRGSRVSMFLPAADTSAD